MVAQILVKTRDIGIGADCAEKERKRLVVPLALAQRVGEHDVERCRFPEAGSRNALTELDGTVRVLGFDLKRLQIGLRPGVSFGGIGNLAEGIASRHRWRVGTQYGLLAVLEHK